MKTKKILKNKLKKKEVDDFPHLPHDGQIEEIKKNARKK
jgi:hypothetical protein|tara:strand:+ start:2374 stop:2490 length:117 start_codon:yes stop_codon:yes gene_type:complete